VRFEIRFDRGPLEALFERRRSRLVCEDGFGGLIRGSHHAA
jgi:hypothetical protein